MHLVIKYSKKYGFPVKYRRNKEVMHDVNKTELNDILSTLTRTTCTKLTKW